jgi:hypothetical protein
VELARGDPLGQARRLSHLAPSPYGCPDRYLGAGVDELVDNWWTTRLDLGVT